MVDSLRASLGLYGATLVIGFVAGMFPLVSIELFVVGVTAYTAPPPGELAALVALGALGHQIAKTITYYAGAGVFELPRGRVRARIEALKGRVARWNRWPRLVLFVSAAVGLPPLYLLGFIAQPLMKLTHTTFTAVSLSGRVLRLTTLVIVTRLVRG